MKLLTLLKNLLLFPIRFIEYITIILFSLTHELGHAKCILNIAKHNNVYDSNKYVVIAFGDYKNGKLICSLFYPNRERKKDIRICFFSNSPNNKIKPITLSSYYAKFNRTEIVACAKAGYEAELHCLHRSIKICIFSFIALVILQCLFVLILLLFCVFFIIIRGCSCKLAWPTTKVKKNGYYVRNDYYYAHCPKSFNKKWKSHAYYNLIHKYL